MASFDSTKVRLFDVLTDVKHGLIQLPDFHKIIPVKHYELILLTYGGLNGM